MEIPKYYAWLNLGLCLCAPFAHGAVFLSASSSPQVPNRPRYEFLNEQHNVRDVIGDNANSGFLAAFDQRSEEDRLSSRLWREELGENAAADRRTVRVSAAGRDVDLTGYIDTFMTASRVGSESALGLYKRKTKARFSPIPGTAAVSLVPSHTTSLHSLRDYYRPDDGSDGRTAIDLTSGVGGSVEWSVSSRTPGNSVTGFLDELSPGINPARSRQAHSIDAPLTRAESLKQSPRTLQSGVSFSSAGVNFGTLSPLVSPIPEPGACMLMAVAALMLGHRRRLNA